MSGTDFIGERDKQIQKMVGTLKSNFVDVGNKIMTK